MRREKKKKKRKWLKAAEAVNNKRRHNENSFLADLPEWSNSLHGQNYLHGDPALIQGMESQEKPSLLLQDFHSLS